MNKSFLVPGQQVIYKPRHVQKTTPFEYPNGAQPGFITSGPVRNDDIYFVMYWQLNENGEPIKDLRTKASSEATFANDILVCDGVNVALPVPQEWVEWAWKKYRGG